MSIHTVTYTSAHLVDIVFPLAPNLKPVNQPKPASVMSPPQTLLNLIILLSYSWRDIVECEKSQYFQISKPKTRPY
jgi:hypothetical protein